MGAIAP
jgi:hypothetical protein